MSKNKIANILGEEFAVIHPFTYTVYRVICRDPQVVVAIFEEAPRFDPEFSYVDDWRVFAEDGIATVGDSNIGVMLRDLRNNRAAITESDCRLRRIDADIAVATDERDARNLIDYRVAEIRNMREVKDRLAANNKRLAAVLAPEEHALSALVAESDTIVRAHHGFRVGCVGEPAVVVGSSPEVLSLLSHMLTPPNWIRVPDQLTWVPCASPAGYRVNETREAYTQKWLGLKAVDDHAFDDDISVILEDHQEACSEPLSALDDSGPTVHQLRGLDDRAGDRRTRIRAVLVAAVTESEQREIDGDVVQSRDIDRWEDQLCEILCPRDSDGPPEGHK